MITYCRRLFIASNIVFLTSVFITLFLLGDCVFASVTPVTTNKGTTFNNFTNASSSSLPDLSGYSYYAVVREDCVRTGSNGTYVFTSYALWTWNIKPTFSYGNTQAYFGASPSFTNVSNCDIVYANTYGTYRGASQWYATSLTATQGSGSSFSQYCGIQSTSTGALMTLGPTGVYQWTDASNYTYQVSTSIESCNFTMVTSDGTEIFNPTTTWSFTGMKFLSPVSTDVVQSNSVNCVLNAVIPNTMKWTQSSVDGSVQQWSKFSDVIEHSIIATVNDNSVSVTDVRVTLDSSTPITSSTLSLSPIHVKIECTVGGLIVGNNNLAIGSNFITNESLLLGNTYVWYRDSVSFVANYDPTNPPTTPDTPGGDVPEPPGSDGSVLDWIIYIGKMILWGVTAPLRLLKDLASNISTSVTNINDGFSQMGSFFTTVFGWLPAPVSSSITIVLISICVLGVIRIFRG